MKRKFRIVRQGNVYFIQAQSTIDKKDWHRINCGEYEAFYDLKQAEVALKFIIEEYLEAIKPAPPIEVIKEVEV
jgi:hypothetical protein